MSTRDLIQVRRMASTGAAKAIRQSAGVSLAEVAADVGVTRSCVHRWERGVRRPRGDAALRYLRLLEELSGVRA